MTNLILYQKQSVVFIWQDEHCFLANFRKVVSRGFFGGSTSDVDESDSDHVKSTTCPVV